MTIGNEILTSTAILTFIVGILGYFIRRWMERIESKVDAIVDYRTMTITRDECSRKSGKLHDRLDGHISDASALTSRVAAIEGKLR